MRVLIVDDEYEFANALAERLDLRGFQTSVAYDGDQALLAADREHPDAIVLDLKMPGMDGMEVLEKVKKIDRRIQVVILTGHGSEKDRERAIDHGAFDYFNKPVMIETLVGALTRAEKDSDKSSE